MKTIWIARLKDTSPGGCDAMSPSEDRQTAMDEARYYMYHRTGTERETNTVSVECYEVPVPESAPMYEALHALFDNSKWPDPVEYIDMDHKKKEA